MERFAARELMIDNIDFLKKIFQSYTVDFKEASPDQLRILYYILYFLCNRKWMIKEQILKDLKDADLHRHLLKNIRNKEYLKQCLMHPKLHIPFLEKFRDFFPLLLAPVFVEDYSKQTQ
jgi:hypothetical protein